MYGGVFAHGVAAAGIRRQEGAGQRGTYICWFSCLIVHILKLPDIKGQVMAGDAALAGSGSARCKAFDQLRDIKSQFERLVDVF